MRDTSLKKVDCLAALQGIKTQYIKTGPGICNNVYLLDHFLSDGGHFRGAFLEEREGCVVCFLDQNTHYQLIMSVPFASGCCLPKMDKEVCCEFVAYSSGHGEGAERFQTLLRQNGFNLLGVYQELRYCAGRLHPGAKAQLQDALAYLERLEMHLEPARPESKEDIERLVSSEIGKYDAFTCGEAEWSEQIARGNVIAIYRGDELVAFDFFQPTGSRFVVKPAFRGMQLGYIVKIAYLAEERWERSEQWQRAWVATDNAPSRRTMQKLGYSQTNRLRYRFIRYPRVEGLK